MVSSLPPLVVCRFILNLRQVKPAGSSWISGNQSHSLRCVGNMGESLQFGELDEDLEESELEEKELIAGLKLPELATEAANLGRANKGDVGSHLTFDIQEVRWYSSKPEAIRSRLTHLP